MFTLYTSMYIKGYTVTLARDNKQEDIDL